MNYQLMVVYMSGNSGRYPPPVTSQLLQFHTYEEAELAIKSIDNDFRQSVVVIRFYKPQK